MSAQGTIIYHPRFSDHVQSEWHPERPERLDAILGGLARLGYGSDVESSTIEPAPEEALLRVHSGVYLETLKAFGEGWIDPDTAIHPETFEIARLAAGGALLAARRAREGRFALALLRPPGHHATADTAMGFCYLNNAAVAAADAVERGERVAVVDIDVHHGNGTNDIFHASPDVLYVSTHQWGIFPGTGHYTDVGEGLGKGCTVNVPFPSGAGDRSLDGALASAVLPALEAFQPDLVLVSLGVDGHLRDPLAGLTYSSEAYCRALADLNRWSVNLCARPCAVVLEGGYDLQALAEVVPTAYHHIVGESPLPEFPSGPSPDTEGKGLGVVREVCTVHGGFPRHPP